MDEPVIDNSSQAEVNGDVQPTSNEPSLKDIMATTEGTTPNKATGEEATIANGDVSAYISAGETVALTGFENTWRL